MDFMSLSPRFRSLPPPPPLPDPRRMRRLRHLMISRRTLLAASAVVLPTPLPAQISAAQSPVGLRAYARRSTNELMLRDDGGAIYSFRAAFGREDGPKRRRDETPGPRSATTCSNPHAPRRAGGGSTPSTIPTSATSRMARRAASRAASSAERDRHPRLRGVAAPTDLVASHGVGWNWTSGCIAVSHEEIEIVRMLVQRPIPLASIREPDPLISGRARADAPVADCRSTSRSSS